MTMAFKDYGAIFLLFALLLSSNVLPSQQLTSSKSGEISGKKWAVLVAGSNGYWNYRHQADVCHAYQIMKKGGLKDENIVVFMYDDIAFNQENPRPGIIINKPHGVDVYDGVPKDYTGETATAQNLFAVILGNKSALTGGSGKVVDSGPNDYIFIYYADHGATGFVAMPAGGYLYAKDLIDVLKKKHESKTYKSMVFYMEACESGSMFEGLLPNNWNIYAVTAANAEESSFATYCPYYFSGPPTEYGTCLGDVFSISWLEDSDIHDMSKETVEKQYQVVKRRTGNDTMGKMGYCSHVMEYGNMELREDFLSFYIGADPANANLTDLDNVKHVNPSSLKRVNQRDADLVHLKYKIRKAREGSEERIKAEKKLQDAISDRNRVDRSINKVARILLGHKFGPEILKSVRPSGQPVVDDWDCFKLLINVYEVYCGPLSSYGKKYSRAIANMCNFGINVGQMTVAAKQACAKIDPRSGLF